MAKKKTKKKTSKKKGTESKKTVKSKKNKVKKTSSKKAKKKESVDFNNTLRNILIISGIIVLIIAISVFSDAQPRTFEYRGVDYNIVEFCDGGPPCLITYNTKLPITQDGRSGNYNFYLRNDPRVLDEEVPFNGSLTLREDLNLNITYGRSCSGYSSIAIQNFATLMGVAGINLSNSSESGVACDETGKEMYVMIQEGNETGIEQIGPACYNININGCEVLQGTERFMNEMFVYLDRIVKK